MEASALRHGPALAGRSPLLRLQSDERLVALIRRGHHGAFEALVQRYQPRLLAFCRHMLGSKEDAEDVLQEVFAASFNAICADERPINARPWLYRIARNRCLNHLRRPAHAGQDSMDVFERDGGTTTADTVHKREEFRRIVSDVQDLPETQRTALLLREIDALSYDQIAEAMDTTVPSVKSLLVRARVSLAEAAEARLLTCEEVRLELGQVAEGLAKTRAPLRRHLKSCERCRIFRVELRSTTKALAAVYPIGPLIFLKKLGLAKLGFGGAAGGAAAGGSSLAGGAGAGLTAASGMTAGGALSAGAGAVASKAVAATAAAVIVTAGAVEVRHATTPPTAAVPAHVAQAPRIAAPTAPKAKPKAVVKVEAKPKPKPKPVEVAKAPPPPTAPSQAMPGQPPAKRAPQSAVKPAPTPDPSVQQGESTVTLPPGNGQDPAEQEPAPIVGTGPATSPQQGQTQAGQAPPQAPKRQQPLVNGQ